MSEREFPAAGPGAGINSQIGAERAKPVVVRNSRFLIGVTLLGSVAALVMSLCMVLVALSLVFPVAGLDSDKGWGAFRWALAAVAMGSMCPWLWQMGRAMADYQVRLDSRGVDFQLGTKRKPQELFVPWDQIAAIRHKRVGNNKLYFVTAANGSEARFSSYTFFRPKKVARLIAARAGQTIRKV